MRTSLFTLAAAAYMAATSNAIALENNVVNHYYEDTLDFAQVYADAQPGPGTGIDAESMQMVGKAIRAKDLSKPKGLAQTNIPDKKVITTPGEAGDTGADSGLIAVKKNLKHVGASRSGAAH